MLESFSQMIEKLEENEFGDVPIDSFDRPLRVAVVGAGIAGIIAGILLPRKVPNLELVIIEKNPGVGGTWFENIYPGVRCDVPVHAYQLSFEPNVEWSEFYATGAEIRRYWDHVADKYKVKDLIRFNTKVIRANYLAKDGLWEISSENSSTGEIVTETFNIFIPATGQFNNFNLPDFKGIDTFQGHLCHSAHWDPSFDVTNKKVAVIGNGASGIQLVANIQEKVGQLDHYARSGTWIGRSFGLETAPANFKFTPEDVRNFKDPAVYRDYRKNVEANASRRIGGIWKGSEANDSAQLILREEMGKRLGKKKDELLPKIIPDFSPGCRRLTPGPGYLEALSQDNVEYITTPIEKIVHNGIQTVDGKIRQVDAIVCCTGAQPLLAPAFPVTNGKIELASKWKANQDVQLYLGIADASFPNLLINHGPMSAGPGGTVIRTIETQTTYIAKILRKMILQRYKTIVPKQEAVDDFVAYRDHYFSKTVLHDGCSSWYNGQKKGGTVFGMWPGTTSHSVIVRSDPRWEDFHLESHSQNRFAWLGSGLTHQDTLPDGDLTPHIKLANQYDLELIHENWNEIRY